MNAEDSTATALPAGEGVAVLVTYGDRRTLLCTVLDALRATSLRAAVVVDNGASWPVRETLHERYGDFVDVVTLPRNLGSAPGYAAGLQRAMDRGAPWLFLLDDDNSPEPDALAILCEQYRRASAVTSPDRLAVLAFRPDHQPDVVAGAPAARLDPRRDAFFGIHLIDIPAKLWRRTSWGRPRPVPMPEVALRQTAPYGGLLFRRELVEAIGLPNPDFVLYGDDTEYSWRVKARGGRILLVTGARLRDLEASWRLKAHYTDPFRGWLLSGSDFRAYYGMRNHSYFNRYRRCRNRIVFTLNCWLYRGILRFIAWRLGPSVRVRHALLLRAIRDGLAGRLGVAADFPLPQSTRASTRRGETTKLNGPQGGG